MTAEDQHGAAAHVISGSVLALTAQTPGTTVDRRALGPRRWREDLASLGRSGFRSVDLTDGWLRFPDLSTSEIDDLHHALADLALPVTEVHVSRCSVIDAERGEEHLAYTHGAVEVAARLGAPVVGMGFHPRLTGREQGVMFWEVPSAADDRSDATWDLATARVREVCDHAAAEGVAVSVELYEDSLVCTGADVERLVVAVDRPNLGVNPDLGNTYRSATPQRESWLATLRGALPHTNLWHLKNYARWSASPAGPFAVVPTTLGEGGIDYRLAVREALAAGYAGPFVIEHYGGDALWMQERGRRYLVRLLDDLHREAL